MDEIVQYQTNLETSNDISGTLSWKITALQDEGRDVPTNLADYIYLADKNLTNQLAALKQLESEIKARKTAINDQITAIKIQGAHFLQETGIERLGGNLVSSITITAPTPAKEKQKVVRDCTPKEIDEILLNLGKAHLEFITADEVPAKIKINKRKIIVPEVE